MPALVFAGSYEYEASKDHPFGQPNPDGHENVIDFDGLIGECECDSERRNPDGSWQEIVTMTWRWKYIMNGLAVQDETFTESGFMAGSIRQINPETGKWHVYYYSTGGAPDSLNAWIGGKVDDSIVLSQPQTAPNGMEGFSRLTFYDISDAGFKWVGEWVDNLEAPNVVYPFWKIDCKR
ncbi:MAG: hypothetical protein HKN21_16015 [Candidatus Eisenbacteria bacterium]|uniref:DUF1579 domain-containing protein n=1 Tax=Eiseniibacteriota bacterium TaxID=2212470 RepID=A0A7Y2EAJ1_UNCEI|nr:hypothetical protein [Candidatus Eisenbacteria bacterium]